MDAIITAGGVNRPDDPLYELTGVKKKALIPLAGKPMVNRVAEALYGSGLVDNIVIVGLQADEVDFGDMPVHLIDSAGGMIDNILVALNKAAEISPGQQKVLLASSDIPLITADIVRGFVAECGDRSADVYYAIVEEKTMENRFPGSRRTFVPFKGGRYSGGDMFLADMSIPDKTDLDLFRALTGSRKNYLEQARLLGVGFIFRFVFRMMTVAEAAERGSQITNLAVRAIDTQFAELGMDLDKPRQYEMIKAILEQQQTQANVG
jgi:molybdopterin-guanine dinucleotide biosynthesis protein A